MFNNPFSFNGRIRRLEYVLSHIIYLIFVGVITVLFIALGDPEGFVTNVLMIVLWIPLLWFMLAQGAKRCHDRDNSGWFQMIPFYSLWMLFAPGDIGDNEYGPNPKGLYYEYDAGTNKEDVEPIDDVDEDGIIKTK